MILFICFCFEQRSEFAAQVHILFSRIHSHFQAMGTVPPLPIPALEKVGVPLLCELFMDTGDI